jgi:hypothetical protein
VRGGRGFHVPRGLPLDAEPREKLDPTQVPSKKSSGALSGCVGIGLGGRLVGERYGWGFAGCFWATNGG